MNVRPGDGLDPAEVDAILAAVAALLAQARAAGAAEERERRTYRDAEGTVLYCPKCGASSPEGYTEEVLGS